MHERATTTVREPTAPHLDSNGLVFLVSWDEFRLRLVLQVTNRLLPPLLYYFAAFGYRGTASARAALMLAPALLIIALLAPAIRAGALRGSGR
jgi:ABC-type spermidine/putrescine transport system permease subunit II